MAINLKLPIVTDTSDTFQRDVRNALAAIARAIPAPVEPVEGVPVTAADIHAALVELGLITA
jgi:phosphoglycolate phosphatase-like HAD superfamily hydrolase